MRIDAHERETDSVFALSLLKPAKRVVEVAQKGVDDGDLVSRDPVLISFRDDLVENRALGKRIFAEISAEWRRTADALALITGQAQRLASNPALARSIEHRFPYLDPLNHVQIELLRHHSPTPTI